jgi:hypothetical protein
MMSLKTNEIIMAVLNNDLEQARQLLTETTPGGIDPVSDETIEALESRGYDFTKAVSEKKPHPLFLLGFMILQWSSDESNAEKIELLQQTLFHAYLTASPTDYFDGLLTLANELAHQKKQGLHVCWSTGLETGPRPGLDSLYKTIITEIAERKHPPQALKDFLDNKQYAMTLTDEIKALFPTCEISNPYGYGKKENIDYPGFYEALKYRETNPTLLTALTHHELLRWDNRKFTDSSHLEKLNDCAKARGEALRLQLPLSEDQLLRYLDSDTYQPETLKKRGYFESFEYSRSYHDEQDAYARWSEQEKEAKFSARYALLSNLGLSEQKIRAELLKPYLLGVIKEEDKPRGYYGSNKVKTHRVFPQWQIKGLLQKLGCNINDTLVDGEKPIVACFKQRFTDVSGVITQTPVHALEHLLSVGGITLDDEDVNTLIEAARAEYQVLEAEAEEKKQAMHSYTLEPLQNKIGVIYRLLSDFEPCKLRLLQQAHEMKLLPKALEDTFQKEEARLMLAIDVMRAVCDELSTDKDNPEAKTRAASKLEEALKNQAVQQKVVTEKKLKKVKPSEPPKAEEAAKEQSPSPLPVVVAAPVPAPAAAAASQVAVVSADETTFRANFLAFIEGQALNSKEAPLMTALLQDNNNQDRVDFITRTMQTHKTKDFAALKNDLITLVEHYPNAKAKLQAARTQESNEEHNRAQTYLTFILGLGQSGFQFKQTEALIKLDVELGIIEPPSKLQHSLARLSRWVQTPKGAITPTIKFPSPKRPQ